MDIEILRSQVNFIDEIKGDDEAAHVQEKYLWENALVGIASGADNPQELAREALKSRNINFRRWYA